MTPMLAGVILILGLSASYYLTRSEKAQIEQLNIPGRRLFIDELEYTTFKHYRDRLIQEYQAPPD